MKFKLSIELGAAWQHIAYIEANTWTEALKQSSKVLGKEHAGRPMRLQEVPDSAAAPALPPQVLKTSGQVH